MKIAVDAMGGDFAPSAIVDGSVQAAREGIPVVLVGDRVKVEEELSRHSVKGLPVTLRHASEVVGMAESPSAAVRKKKDSSIRVCFDMVKTKEASAVVSAGNSGAAMACGMLILKKLKGVDRPAIAVSVPTLKGPAVILDVGGNVDCKPIHLLQFAIMGSVYARYVFKEERPRVGLLSNGEEEEKGTELTRAAHDLIKKTSINYIGYIEGKNVYGGDVDVVTTDGFTGNVVLKLTEGLVDAVMKMLKKEIKENFSSRMGYLLSRGAFRNLKKKMDYAEYGGAPLLGIDGVCVISHGSSSARAIKNAIMMAAEYVKEGVNTHLTEELEKNRDLEKIAARESV